MEIDDVAGDRRNAQVIRPHLIAVKGRQYRTLFQPGTLISGSNKDASVRASVIQAREEANEIRELEFCNDESIEGVDVDVGDDGRYYTRVEVPSAFTGKLIGKQGSAKRALEADTKTTVTVPRRGDGELVTITGDTKTSVSACRTRIEMLVIESIKKAPNTHFISVPLSGANFEAALETFKQQSMDFRAKGLSEELFIDPAKLHLTIGTLKLYGKSQIDEAAGTLKDCAALIQNVLPKKTAKIIVQGVEYMNDDPCAVDILYACVRLNNDSLNQSLQAILNDVRNRFIKEGLMEREFERNDVKLHATIINTKKRNNNGPRTTFDATRLLQKFRSYVNIALMPIDLLHLSRMVPRAKNHKGYYEPECIAKI